MKKIFILLFTLCSLHSFAQVPIQGLVAWYPFSGNANDYTDNKNNGTVNGATLTTDRFGNANSAYSFNGTTSNISIASASSISDFPNGQTLSFWMKISEYPSDGKEHYIIDKTDNWGNPSVKFYQAFISNYTSVNNVVYRYAQSSSVSSQGTAIPFSNIPLNEWFHICFTTDLTITKTYINGVHFLTYTHYSPIGVTSNPLKFGNCNGVGSTNAPYNGLLDDIRIYNRALSQNEVTSIYTEGVCINNITVSDTLKIGRITGVNSLPDNFGLVKVYPNPTKDVLNISATNSSASYTIQITNNIGTVLYSNSLQNNNLQVNLNTLGANGLYFIKILDISNNVLDTRKLVLE